MPDLTDELANQAFSLAVLAFAHMRRRNMLKGKSDAELDRIENDLIDLNISVAESNISKLKNIPE